MLRMVMTAVGLALTLALFGNSLASWLNPDVPSTERTSVSLDSPGILPDVVALKADSRGHFVTDIRINGQFVSALVDTGASFVAMSAEDAAKAGVRPGAGDPSVLVSTANGVVRAQRTRVASLKLQSIEVRDVEVTVMPRGALSHTLLGMTFLKRLASFEMRGNTLVLRR